MPLCPVQVLLASDTKTGSQLAVKVIRKQLLVAGNNRAQAVLLESSMLRSLAGNPFLIRGMLAFQTKVSYLLFQ